MVKEGPIQLTLPNDLADIVRARLAGGGFASAVDVVRAALALLGTTGEGDDAETIRKKIDVGYEQAEAGQLIDGREVMDRWRKRQDQHGKDAGR